MFTGREKEVRLHSVVEGLRLVSTLRREQYLVRGAVEIGGRAGTVSTIWQTGADVVLQVSLVTLSISSSFRCQCCTYLVFIDLCIAPSRARVAMSKNPANNLFWVGLDEVRSNCMTQLMNCVSVPLHAVRPINEVRCFTEFAPVVMERIIVDTCPAIRAEERHARHDTRPKFA
jgi:hypothetical protein